MSFTPYSSSSPYSQTSQTSWYLDTINFINIPKFDDDVKITITSKLQYRPDLLSNELYNTTKFWWVFAVRNPNIIVDPIWGLTQGLIIFAPSKEQLVNLTNG